MIVTAISVQDTKIARSHYIVSWIAYSIALAPATMADRSESDQTSVHISSFGNTEHLQ